MGKSEIECKCIMKEEMQRVKSVTFHPCKKVLIAGLHNGKIQGYNYLYKTKLFELEEHEGPVRVVVFHHLIERFASGGDDCLIRIWNYKNRSVETVFKGHTDYIRSIEYHKHLPWLISTSDDQTIRIWNFQSKKQIACLAGHTHYVMCARFISDALFVSVSLDQTIRLWDYSALKTKSQSTVMDMLGVPEVIVKHIMDGHERGINWVANKEDSSMFATGGDDSSIRIWDASGDSVFETDSLQGHHSHVSSLYYTKSDILISNSEDGTMKVWDTKKRKILETITLDNRFWCIAMDKEEKVFAAGHDTGFVVYSLERESPVYAVKDKEIYIQKGLEVVRTDTQTEQKVADVQKSIRSISVGESVVVVNYKNSYMIKGSSTFKGTGYCVVSGDTLIVAAGNEVVKKSLDGREKGSVEMEVEKVFTTDVGVFGKKDKNIFMIDFLGKTQKNITLLGNCKNIIAKDGIVAVQTEKHLHILDETLTQVSVIEEVVGINSMVIKDSTIFYTTPMHIKFAFASGECSALISTEEPQWLVWVEGEVFTTITRDGSILETEVDMIEWQFKGALEKKDTQTVQECIQTDSLIGQSSLAYLIRKGCYDEALKYIEDPEIKVELYIKTKDFAKALKCAEQLDSTEIYTKIGKEAIHFDVQTSEESFKRAKDYPALLLLYVAMNRTDKISAVVNECPDVMYKAVAAILTGDNDRLSQLIHTTPDIKDIAEPDSTTPALTHTNSNTHDDSLNLSLSEYSDSADDLLPERISNTTNTTTASNTINTTTTTTTSTVPPRIKSLNVKRFEMGLKNLPKDLNTEDELKVALECVSAGKTTSAINVFLMVLYQQISLIQTQSALKNTNTNPNTDTEQVITQCSTYLQALLSDRLRKKTQSDKVALSCGIFHASLDLQLEHKEKALKAAVAICYKRGNKHSAMELSKELVEEYGCTDERILALAQTDKHLSDALIIDTSLPFCIDIGEYAEDCTQCGICKAWSSAKCEACQCCFVSNL